MRCIAQYREEGNVMKQVEYGKKYYRINGLVWNNAKEDYVPYKGETEYKTERGAKIALAKKVVTPTNMMYELIEYEYDPDYPGLICNDRRLLIKDNFGTYAD